jgi:HSP20 family molecular chaperone IbpA
MLNTLDRINCRGSKIYQDLLDEVLDPFFNGSGSKVFSFEEKDDGYFVNLEMAGVDKKQCKAEVKEGFLRVSAKREGRSFNYTASIPRDAAAALAKATIKNGLLTIVIPKVESAKSQLIQIS